MTLFLPLLLIAPLAALACLVPRFAHRAGRIATVASGVAIWFTGNRVHTT